jgi:hypothetical protein
VLARVELERRRLARIDELRTTGPAAALLETFAGDRLNTVVADLSRQLDRLEAKAGKRVDGAILGEVVELQKAVDRAASEALDLAMGSLARLEGLDANACEEADQLVVWLADRIDRRFIRPTVPGGEEALHRATDVVYRRVPDHGLWDLPVIAHEFGHLVAAGLRSWDARGDQVLSPVESWLENFDGEARARATELFCDVFATYTMGPSYLCALVFHRLSPVAAARASPNDTHPGDPSRVFTCRWTLQRMRGTKPNLHVFDSQMVRADAAWTSMQSDAPAEARLTDAVRAELRTQLAGCWVTLTNALSALAYQPATSVQHLVRYLESASVERPETLSPADVLNAAWIVRLGSWYDDRHVAPGMEHRAQILLGRSLERRSHARP